VRIASKEGQTTFQDARYVRACLFFGNVGTWFGTGFGQPVPRVLSRWAGVLTVADSGPGDFLKINHDNGKIGEGVVEGAE